MAKTKKNPWTSDEEAKLRELRKKKYKTAAIAKILGRSVCSVYRKINVLNRYNAINSPFGYAKANQKTRSCLRCKNTFLSEGSGNRLCGSCKATNSTKNDIQYAIGI